MGGKVVKIEGMG